MPLDQLNNIFQCRLYLISPPGLDPVGFSSTLARALDAGDVAAFQLRLDPAEDIQILRAVEVLLPIARERDVEFILNDRPDLAKKSGCDGVHLGVQDMNVKDARALLGADKTIGASCHDSKHLAMVAAERGADYVSFGPFFSGRTPFYPKDVYDPNRMVPPLLVTWWSEMMEIPCVAAGGLRPDNCQTLVKAGADFICASAAIWEHPQGAPAAVRAFNDAIAHARES